MYRKYMVKVLEKISQRKALKVDGKSHASMTSTGEVKISRGRFAPQGIACCVCSVISITSS